MLYLTINTLTFVISECACGPLLMIFYIDIFCIENTRLTQRLMQAIKGRNKSKLQKCLARMREANNDKMVADIAMGEVVLMELVAEDGE